MRRFWAPLTFIGLTAAVHGLWGQAPPLQAPSPYPSAATILVSQVDVYSGPGGASYQTSRLAYGAQITVLGESRTPGWLVIKPPPGSYSWIDARYVKPVTGMDRIGIVDAGDPRASAPILAGSSVVNKEPSGEITKVATGTQLLLLDRPTSSSSGGASYYPIAPVATDVRFIPKDAVGHGGSYAANNSGYGNYGGQTIPTGWQMPAGPATNPTSFMDLAKQGDQALAAGNVDRARLLFIEAIAQTNDPAWRNYLTNQLARVSPNTGPPSAPFQSASSPAGVRPGGAPNWNPAAPPVGPTGFPPAAPPVKQWSPWGILRSTTITTNEGQRLYLLVDKDGSPLMYVATQPGSSLNGYITQTIAIYGTLTTRNDPNINMQLLIAEQIATPPAGAK